MQAVHISMESMRDRILEESIVFPYIHARLPHLHLRNPYSQDPQPGPEKIMHTEDLPFASPPVVLKKQLDFTHLYTQNDWVIGLNNDTKKLVAFNDAGCTIEARGDLICVDGYAFLYKDGWLWKGLMEQVDTVRQERKEAEAKRRSAITTAKLKIEQKYQKEIDKLNEKWKELHAQREQEVQNFLTNNREEEGEEE